MYNRTDWGELLQTDAPKIPESEKLENRIGKKYNKSLIFLSAMQLRHSVLTLGKVMFFEVYSYNLLKTANRDYRLYVLSPFVRGISYVEVLRVYRY